ncbi:hypothetical protein ACFLYD_08850 [Chloroflexota bacterium]
MALSSNCDTKLVDGRSNVSDGGPPYDVSSLVHASTKDPLVLRSFHQQGPIAFLYRMVRSIVGMLVLVGTGQVLWEDFVAILQSRDRSQIRQVAPPHGLCLMRVEYAAREGVL